MFLKVVILNGGLTCYIWSNVFQLKIMYPIFCVSKWTIFLNRFEPFYFPKLADITNAAFMKLDKVIVTIIRELNFKVVGITQNKHIIPLQNNWQLVFFAQSSVHCKSCICSTANCEYWEPAEVKFLKRMWGSIPLVELSIQIKGVCCRSPL